MRRMRWAAYLWPGLPQLSAHGRWGALVLAVAAAILLNLAILGTFAWSELLGGGVRITIWLFSGGIWIVAALWSMAEHRRPQPANPDGPDNTFEAALDHYLRGNWFETERALVSLLHYNESDVEARLMLATLLRHRHRFDEAADHLEQLQRREDTWRWEWEICRERQRLAEAQTDAEVVGTDDATEAETETESIPALAAEAAENRHVA